MPATTSEDFLEALKKSELLLPEQVKQIEDKADQRDGKIVALGLINQGLITTWQANMLLAGKHMLKVGKYKLLQQIGRGKLNHVHLAEHEQMGRKVAIKTLVQRHAKKQESVDKFIAEARVVATLDNQNIIHVYDIGQHGDRLFLVTEHVEGRDLQSLVEKKGPLPPKTVANFLRQTAEGLAYAHQQKIFHHDLRPADLLLDIKKVIKIQNLGMASIANVYEEDEKHYQAPEVLANDDQVDGRADIYSLGCIGLFLLTGKTPPTEATGAPQELTDLLQKMMNHDPSLRFQMAEEVSTALTDFSKNYSPRKKVSKKLALKRAISLKEDEEAYEVLMEDLINDRAEEQLNDASSFEGFDMVEVEPVTAFHKSSAHSISSSTSSLSSASSASHITKRKNMNLLPTILFGLSVIGLIAVLLITIALVFLRSG